MAAYRGTSSVKFQGLGPSGGGRGQCVQAGRFSSDVLEIHAVLSDVAACLIDDTDQFAYVMLQNVNTLLVLSDEVAEYTNVILRGSPKEGLAQLPHEVEQSSPGASPSIGGDNRRDVQENVTLRTERRHPVQPYLPILRCCESGDLLDALPYTVGPGCYIGPCRWM